MSSKNLVIRGGTKLKGAISSGIGDSVLTQNSSTKAITEIGPIDVSSFLTTSLLAGRIIVGNNSNLATPVQMSGAVTIDSSGATTISSGVITNANISTSASIAYSKLNLTGSVLNADISAGAAITRTKLASGTAYRIVVNDVSGIMTEATSITANRVLISDTNGLPTSSSVTTTTLGFLDVTSSTQTQLNNRLNFSSAITPSAGDIVYFSGGVWTNLPRGTSGQYLSSSGSTIQWVSAPNGLPTGGTANQYLSKVDGTDYNTQWSTLTLSKVTDVLALAADVNLLQGAAAFGVTTANIQTLQGVSSNIQSQLNTKLSTALPQNYMFVGNSLGQVTTLAPGTNTYVLTMVSGVPTWSAPTGGGSGHIIQNSGASLTARANLNFTSGLAAVDDALNNASKATIDLTYNFAWAGVHSWLDNNFSIKDNTDTTKILNFQLSGLTTGTTRTYTWPDVTATIATVDGGQTFTSAIWNGTRLLSAYTPQGSAVSVWGVTGLSSADQGSIVAGAAGNVLRRDGSGLSFGTIDLSLSNTVGSSVLSTANGGTSSTTFPGWLLASGGTLTGANNFTMGTNPITFTQGASVSGSPTAWTYNGGSHTTLSIAEVTDVNYNLARTINFTSGGGTIATQRNYRIQAPTYTATTNAVTITNAYTAFINQPVASTNITITNNYGLGVEGGVAIIRSGTSSISGQLTANGSNLFMSALGGGTLQLGVNGTGFGVNTVNGNWSFGTVTTDLSRLYVLQSALSSSWIPVYRSDPGAHTGMTASTEFISRDFQGATQQWSTGSLTTQRWNYFRGYTAAFVGASTLSDAYTVYIDPPVAGTNATITRNWALGLAGSLNMPTSGSSIQLNNGSIILVSGGTIQTTSSGTLTLTTNNGAPVNSTSGSWNFTQSTPTVLGASAIVSTPAALTGLTLATEFISRDFKGATQTWIDGTTATQRFNYFRGYTINKTTTSATFTNAYTVYIDPSTAGTGVTLTNNFALGLNGDLGLISAPANDNALTQVLVRDGTTGKVKYRTAASLAGGSSSGAQYLMQFSDGAGGFSSDASLYYMAGGTRYLNSDAGGFRAGDGTGGGHGATIAPTQFTVSYGSASNYTFSGTGSVNNWIFNSGNVTVPHLAGNTSSPSIAAGTGAGTGPTVSVSGTDLAGTVTVTTGTAPSGANAIIATITFNAAYGSAPRVMLTAANRNANGLVGLNQILVPASGQTNGVTTTTFVIEANTTALAASTTYLWTYQVIQ